MAELWRKHQAGEKTEPGRAYMVDFPEPTEEEKRLMAAYRPASLAEQALRDALEKAAEKLGGD